MITLNHKLDLTTALLHGKISFYRPIPYIIPILMRVREEHDSTPQSVSDHLCIDSTVMCGSILETCKEEGLVRRVGGTYHITDSGNDAISDSLIPETRCDTFWVCYAQHVLLGDRPRILLVRDADRYTGDRQMQIRGPEDPDIFEDSRMETLFGDARRIRIVKVDSMEILESSSTSVNITWSLSKTKSQVKVLYCDGKHSGSCQIEPPDVKFEAIWRQLLRRCHMTHDWDYKNDRLLVDTNTDADERRAMKKILYIKDGFMDVFGEYDGFEVEVDIYPANQRSAQDWAHDLLAGSVADYVTAQGFEYLKESVAARFPEYSVEFGDRNSYIDDIEFSWHIRAMEDWGL